MSQIRSWNYGDPFTSDKLKTLQKVLNCKGVYDGYDITVTDTNKVTLSANGHLLQPNGVMVSETVGIVLEIASLPAVATNYTITCRHTDTQVIGGSAAIYAIEVGTFIPYTGTDISDGVVIGWITYPGGAVALTPAMITQATKNACGGSIFIENASTYETNPTDVLHPDGLGGVVWGPGSTTAWTVVTLIPTTTTIITHIADVNETIYIKPYATGASYTSAITITFPEAITANLGQQIKLKFDLSNFDDEVYLPNDVMPFTIICVGASTVEYLNPFSVFLTHDMCLCFESDGAGNWMRII